MDNILTAEEYLMQKYKVPRDVVQSQCKLEMVSIIIFF